ncbi:hypothetical protein U91I_03495 [alpha proteobacterium U9-1i]|nr:hypothetical protein U91I_03495 [alpha proteobacterium U9-1i]
MNERIQSGLAAELIGARSQISIPPDIWCFRVARLLDT